MCCAVDDREVVGTLSWVRRRSGNKRDDDYGPRDSNVDNTAVTINCLSGNTGQGLEQEFDCNVARN